MSQGSGDRQQARQCLERYAIRPSRGRLARSQTEELSRLLLTPCRLNAVTEVYISSRDHQFLKGALFARICTEAAALRRVTL